MKRIAHSGALRAIARGICFLAALMLTGMSLSAQTAQLTPEQTLKRWSLSDLRHSPDGGMIAFTVGEPVSGSSQRRNIWMLDTDSRRVRRFTTSEKSDRRPRWSPDGKTLAFLSNRNGKTQIYRIPADGGEAVALTDSKTGIESFEWSPGGGRIAFLAEKPKTEEEKKREEEQDDARVQDKDDRHALLWVFDVETREVRELTSDAWRVSGFVWSPDGERLIISATDHPQPELETGRIYALPVRGGEMHEIADPAGPFGSLALSPDGATIAYKGSRTAGPTPFDLFLMPVSGGKARNITAAPVDNPVGTFYWRDNETLILQTREGFFSRFFTVKVDGGAERLVGFPVNPSGSFTEGPGWIAFVGETAVRAPELWLSTESGKAQQVTHFNKEWDNISLVEPEIITYPGFDGKEIEAAVLKPAGYQRGEQIPLVALVHGGPSGVWSDRFDAWGQLLAAHGFAVLYPNIRGSIGYGHDFMISNRYDWGGGDYKDVMAGVDFLIGQGIADPERLGIGGWSYGGYMAAWAITQTARFKASVSGAPMTDLAVEYGTESSSINAYDTWYLGTPYENMDAFLERSPLTHVKKVTTPVLILCGENDATDPIGQCQQFYRGLKRYGVDTEFVRYPREGHGIREEKHRIDLLNRMLGWFEKYLKQNGGL